MGGQAWKDRKAGKRKRSLSSVSHVIIQGCVFASRRLNTLNKCASMKLDVSLQRKKVSAGSYVICSLFYIESCAATARTLYDIRR